MRQAWQTTKTIASKIFSWSNIYWRRFLDFSTKHIARQKLFISEQKRFRDLHKLPWYLVLGPQQSGKKSLLMQSGIQWQRAEEIGEVAEYYCDNFADLNWAFSRSGIFMSADSDNYFRDPTNIKNWVKALLKHRRKQPLSGLLLTLDINQWLLSSKQQQQAYLQNVADLLITLNKSLKSQIPVYLIWTQCDKIDGFSEFFHELSQEELTQVWGLTFPLIHMQQQTHLMSFCQNQFKSLIERIQQRVMWLLDSEKSIAAREKIYAFPKQLELLSQPCSQLLADFYLHLKAFNMIHFRGIYFTSSIQDGSANNWLMKTISTQFQLADQSKSTGKHSQEGFFISQLFNQVILAESRILGFNHRTKQRKEWFYRTAWLSLPLLLILGIWQTVSGFNANKQYLQNISHQINSYKHELSRLDFHSAMPAIALPILNTARKMTQHYTQYSNFGMHLLWASHELDDATQSTLNRSLTNFFLPRDALQLENELHRGKMDVNYRYAALKGYLSFSPHNQAPGINLLAPMHIYWGQQYPHNHPKQVELNRYLKRASRLNITALPIDHDLVNKNRLQLQSVIPSQRAYALLNFESNTGDLATINFPQMIGSGLYEIFISNKKMKVIPAFYTTEGFNKLLKKQLPDVANEVANDNYAIGLSNQTDTTPSKDEVNSQVEAQYSRNYLNTWNNTLASLSVKPFKSFATVNHGLSLLASDQSPLWQLINIIKHNTNSISADNIHIDDKFDGMNDYASHSKQADINEAFTKLKVYLKTIAQQSNPDKASFDQAQDYFKDSSDNPIYKLSKLAKAAPQPLRGWLEAVANNSLALVLTHARAYINQNWQSQVVDHYGSRLSDRFPLNPNANGELDLTTFSEVFSAKGVLSKFYAKFVKPFVNSDKSKWNFYSKNSQTIGLSEKSLSFFHRLTRIQDQFFDNHSKIPHLKLVLEPRLLDNQLREMTLSVGQHNLVYRHGPRQRIALNWPFNQTGQASSLALIDFDGSPDQFKSEGPWSLFKLFNEGHWHHSNNPNEYYLSLKFNGRHVQFTVYSTRPLSTLRLDDLKNWKLPNEL